MPYICRPLKRKLNGLVVQLVRIPACHAGGREFESRPDRKKPLIRAAFFSLKFFSIFLPLTIAYQKGNNLYKKERQQ